MRTIFSFTAPDSLSLSHTHTEANDGERGGFIQRPVQKWKPNQTKSMKHGAAQRAMEHLIQITNPPSYCKKNIPAPITRTLFFPSLLSTRSLPRNPSPDLGTAKARDAEPAPSACRGHEFWQNPRAFGLGRAVLRRKATPRDADPTRSALRSSGRPGPYSSGASTSAPPSTRRCAASEWPCSAA